MSRAALWCPDTVCDGLCDVSIQSPPRTVERPPGPGTGLVSDVPGTGHGPADGGRPAVPDVLRAARLLLILMITAAGVLVAVDAGSRAAAVGDIAGRLSPLERDATDVQLGLAATESAVISAFVTGSRPTRPGDPVPDELDAVSTTLLRASARVDDPAMEEVLARLANRLPDYIGSVARASADDPTGAAALRRSATIVQTELMPPAAQLQQLAGDALTAAQRRSAAFPVALAAAVALILTTMIAVQVWLAQRFRRTLNAGMVLSTVAVLSGVLWWSLAGVAADARGADARAHAAAFDRALAPAQLSAHRARAAEGMELLDGPAIAEDGVEEQLHRLREIDDALGTAEALVVGPTGARVREARVALADYALAHQRVHRAAVAGHRAEAVQLAFGSDPDDSAAAFDRLERSLAAASATERDAFRVSSEQARLWHTTRVPVTILLTLLAAAGAAAGLTARLKEYP